MRVNEYTPVIKEIKPINFLFQRSERKLNELVDLAPVAQELYQEAMRLGLSVTGPLHWHYIGYTDESTPFTLEISLPVAQVPGNYDGRFHFKRTELFKSVSVLHDGDWGGLKSSYDKVMVFIKQNGLQPVPVTREVYINVDFNSPEANVTEIQMGIK